MKPKILAVLLVTVVTGPSLFGQSDAPFYRDEQLSLSFPKKVGPFECTEVKQFDEPGMGFGIRLRLPSTEVYVDFFVYDLQKVNIPNGVDSDVLKKHYNQVKSDITEGMMRNAGWKIVFKPNEDTVPLGDAKTAVKMLHATFRGTTISSEDVETQLFLTGCRKKFIKVRCTGTVKLMEKTQPQIKSLFVELGKVLGQP